MVDYINYIQKVVIINSFCVNLTFCFKDCLFCLIIKFNEDLFYHDNAKVKKTLCNCFIRCICLKTKKTKVLKNYLIEKTNVIIQ